MRFQHLLLNYHMLCRSSAQVKQLRSDVEDLEMIVEGFKTQQKTLADQITYQVAQVHLLDDKLQISSREAADLRSNLLTSAAQTKKAQKHFNLLKEHYLRVLRETQSLRERLCVVETAKYVSDHLVLCKV